MPQISVLVPVYNVECYLEQCLESLVEQSFKDIEMICVDDGSTDCSGLILDRYAASDSRIRVIHKQNTGYGDSMNVALDCARGEYIAILESDDYAEPDMLYTLYQLAVTQKADVVKGDYYHYSGGKDVLCNRLKDYPKGKALQASVRPDILNLADSIWSCIYKHSFLQKYAIRFHETPGASYQDISFAIQVWLCAGKVYFTEDAVIHYRRDNPGSSMNNPTKLFCVFDEYEWIEEKWKDFWQDSPVLEDYFVASKYRDYFNHYFRVGMQYQYALLQRLDQAYKDDNKKGRIKKDAFLPDVWNRLDDMGGNLSQFFKKTGKKPEDERLRMCEFQNEDVYVNAFLEGLKCYPEVLIYGAGQVGQRLAEAIVARGGQVDGFLVTKITDSDGERMGIPVRELEEAVGSANTCAVIIAVTEWTQYELYQNLKKYGYKNIFRADEMIRKIQ